MRAFCSVCLMLLACSTTGGDDDTSSGLISAVWGDVPAWMSEAAPGAVHVEEGRQVVSAAPTLTIPSPPEFVRGGTETVTAEGATPGANVFFIVGPYSEDHTCPSLLGGLCMDIDFSKGRYLGKAVADDGGVATLNVVIPDTERVGTFISEGYSVDMQALQVSPPAVSSATSAVVCDDMLACAEVITCFGSDAYPTACGPDNCDVPIGTCDECGVVDGSGLPSIDNGTCNTCDESGCTSLTCDAGYSADGGACVALSCGALTVEHSDATGSTTGVTGDTATVTCDTGYAGSGVATCDTSGAWDAPTCADASSTCNGTGQTSGAGTCVCDTGYSGTPAWDGSSWDNPCIPVPDGICDGMDGATSVDCDGECDPGDTLDGADCDGLCDWYDDESGDDCDGFCDAGEPAPHSPDCNWSCGPGDAADSEDCNGFCEYPDLPGSVDCNGFCTDWEYGSPDCDGVCNVGDTLTGPPEDIDCDYFCQPGDELGSMDCDGSCNYGDWSTSVDCDGSCDAADPWYSTDCDGICDSDDDPDSFDCD